MIHHCRYYDELIDKLMNEKGKIDRVDPSENYMASFGKYKELKEHMHAYDDLIIPYLTFWPEYQDETHFIADYDCFISINPVIKGQMISFIKSEIERKECSAFKSVIQLVQDVKWKFGHTKESNQVTPPDEINNEPFHPNYEDQDDFIPEEMFEMVEALEFPGSLVNALRTQFMIDQNTAYFWIHEYWKFLVLTYLFKQIVPSTRVLHVWKTHMAINSTNYRACMEKIKTEDKLWKIPFYSVEDFPAYSTTLACYKIIFGEEAPEVVWE